MTHKESCTTLDPQYGNVYKLLQHVQKSDTLTTWLSMAVALKFLDQFDHHPEPEKQVWMVWLRFIARPCAEADFQALASPSIDLDVELRKPIMGKLHLIEIIDTTNDDYLKKQKPLQDIWDRLQPILCADKVPLFVVQLGYLENAILSGPLPIYADDIIRARIIRKANELGVIQCVKSNPMIECVPKTA